MLRRQLKSDRNHELSRTMRAGWMKRIAINIFLVFHLTAIFCWCVPVNSPLLPVVNNLVRPYFIWSGLFQSWDTFSPAPKAVNSYVEAIVLYEDGTTRTWAFPRMEQLRLADRYFKERYRKFVENLKEDANAPLWPDAARYIARLNNNGPSAERMVLLVRYWSAIVPQNNNADAAAQWSEHVFYGYNVQPEDLR